MKGQCGISSSDCQWRREEEGYLFCLAAAVFIAKKELRFFVCWLGSFPLIPVYPYLSKIIFSWFSALTSRHGGYFFIKFQKIYLFFKWSTDRDTSLEQSLSPLHAGPLNFKCCLGLVEHNYGLISLPWLQAVSKG